MGWGMAFLGVELCPFFAKKSACRCDGLGAPSPRAQSPPGPRGAHWQCGAGRLQKQSHLLGHAVCYSKIPGGTATL